MKRQKFLKLLSSCLCIVLVAAIALMTIGCNDNTNLDTVSSVAVDAVSKAEPTNVGEGNTKFEFTVVNKDGKETKFNVSTNKTMVGEALLDAKLIEGEDGQYGLYVKTVNGETLDFDTDGMYWAFYINGEYATSGVDTTEIAEGESYCFKAE